MLVLGCTNHQSVIIDNVIEVTVLNNKQGQVVLGIEVPEGIEIRRKDKFSLVEQIQKSQSRDI
ncbi:MAG: carbon storage regulator [Gammaproteobacteria bacterium]|nr:carbon storage regulator [Gammaproteobacteria bacterium]